MGYRPFGNSASTTADVAQQPPPPHPANRPLFAPLPLQPAAPCPPTTTTITRRPAPHMKKLEAPGWPTPAHTCLLASVAVCKCSRGVGTAPSGLLHHTAAAAAATSHGGPPAAARRCGTCVWLAGRRQLGRCRTLACWHRWGCASAAEGWAQPRLACCTTGSGGGDEPRRIAGGGEAVRCGTCVWLAGRRQLAGVAHLLAGITGGVQVQQRGGHSPVWPAAPHRGSGGGDEPRRPAGGGEAVRCGTCVWLAGRRQLGRCRTLACWHRWVCASAAEGWAQPRLACCTTGSGGGDEPRRPAGGGEAVRCGTCVWLAGRSWAGVAHLLAGISGGCASAAEGWAQPRLGLLHHTAAAAAATSHGGPPAAARRCGTCVWLAGRRQLGRCRTLACWHQWGCASAAEGWAQPRRPATAFVTKTVTWLCLANSKHSWACVGARVNAARAVARKDGCRHAVAMAVLGVMRGVMRREQERGAESKQQVTASFVAIEKLGQAPAFGICRTIRLCSDRCPSAATPCPCKWCGQMGSEDVSATQIQRAPHGQMNAIGGLQGTCAAELNSGVPTQTLASSKPPPSPTYAHCPTLASSHPPPPLPYPHPHPTELTTRGASPRRPRAAAAACRCRQARSYGRRCAPPSVAPAAQDHHTAW